jgi:hypothetical protein
MASIRDTLANLVEQYKASDTPLANLMRGDTEGAKQSAANAFEGMTKDPYAGLNVATPVGIAGTFIGPKSKLWNIDTHNLAKALESKGTAPEEIWKQTGNVKAPDNMWRQEIPDVEAKIKANYNPSARYYEDVNTLGDLIEHPKLFESYPDAKNIQISQFAGKPFTGSSSGAYYSPSQVSLKTLDVIPDRIGLHEDRLLDPETTKSALLHEIGHYVQEQEGLSKGGSTQEFLEPLYKHRDQLFENLSHVNDQLKQSVGTPEFQTLLEKRDKLIPEINKYNDSVDIHDLAYNKYRNLLGEAEARLTQNRMPLTQEQRLQNFPYAEGKFGLDVPYKNLLVKELLKNK